MSIQNLVIPSISIKKPKICVCVPTRDMLHSHFAYSLQALVKHHALIGLDTEVIFESGTLIGTQREKLVASAIENSATHIMWLDSDMMFPHNVCERLLSHNVPFVACNYSTRVLPFKSVAYKELYNWDSSVSSDETGVIKVAGVGLGCALVNIKVFSYLHKPYFPITYVRKTDDYLGEDMNFCMKVDTEGGFQLVIDTDLSKFVYHIGMTAFSTHHLPVAPG